MPSIGLDILRMLRNKTILHGWWNQWKKHPMWFLGIHKQTPWSITKSRMVWLSTLYHAGIGFTEQNLVCFLTYISEILSAISRISAPITGMFVLISMHFSWWFQIWSWNSKMMTFFLNILWFCSLLTCRLPTPVTCFSVNGSNTDPRRNPYNTLSDVCLPKYQGARQEERPRKSLHNQFSLFELVMVVWPITSKLQPHFQSLQFTRRVV